jgi:hypothetical protein
VIVADGEVEIRYVVPTDRASEQVRFCHLRLAYLDRVVEPPPAAVPREAPQLAVPLHLPRGVGVALEPVGHDGARVAGVISGEGAAKEAPGRLLVPLGTEQEVDRLAVPSTARYKRKRAAWPTIASATSAPMTELRSRGL